MNLKPLKKQYGDASGSILVRCASTGETKRWNEAVAAGWVADTEGKPFAAYYSPEGIRIVQNR